MNKLKGIKLNKLFKTNYILITKSDNKKYCIKNGNHWMIIDTDKGEVAVDNNEKVIFFNTKTIAEYMASIYTNRLPLSNLKGIDNLVNINYE